MIGTACDQDGRQFVIPFLVDVFRLPMIAQAMYEDHITNFKSEPLPNTYAFRPSPNGL